MKHASATPQPAKILPLSVFIIAKDEEDRIPHALESVMGWAAEVIVIDSGSSDATVAIAKKMGAKVLHREWEGYGPQKIFGETQCTQDWLLNIDADEAVSGALQAEIFALFAAGAPPEDAYHIPIRIVFRGDKKPRPFAPHNSPIRLYNKYKARFKDALVHDSVVPLHDGATVGWLRAPMHHRCFRSYSHAIEKINRYTSMQAADMLVKGRIPPVWRLIVEPFAAFLKSYFLRRYVLFGVEGFNESMIYAFARFIRLAKAREAWRHDMHNQPR